MIRLRLSRRLLRGVGVAAGLLVLLVAAFLLGNRMTPRDAEGHPLLLSPSVYAAEKYRRATLRWVADMAQLDAELTHILAQEEVADPVRLYDLSRVAQEALEQAAVLARGTTFTPAPPAMSGLAAQAQTAANAYLAAAQATTYWVGAPEPPARRAALEALRQARGLQAQLAASRWLAGFDREQDGH